MSTQNGTDSGGGNDTGVIPGTDGGGTHDGGVTPGRDGATTGPDGTVAVGDGSSVDWDGAMPGFEGGLPPRDGSGNPGDDSGSGGNDTGSGIDDAGNTIDDNVVPDMDSGTVIPDDAGIPDDVDQSFPDVPVSTGANPIRTENALPGTDDWQLLHTAGNHEVEGYASSTSVAPGESFDLKVNVSDTAMVHWEAYRLGYYQGHGGRLVTRGPSRSVSPQSACPIDSTTGLIECHWSTAFTVTPDASWVTGQYLIKLVRDDTGNDIYVPMVVRESNPRAPLVFQASVNTWAAYDTWGGTSLYKNLNGPFHGDHAYKVSFDRPYDPNDSGGGELRRYEMWMVRWLEQKGYDIAYLSNVDVDAHPEWARGRNMFLSVGHDEYWTAGQFDALEAARDSGVNLGFFSANTAYWQVRYENSSSGVPRRVVVGYKEYAGTLDPLRGTATVTGRFRDPPTNRPENSLIGVMYELWSNTDAYPMVVTNPSHWVFQGTGLRAGDTLANVVGYEWDHVFDSPAGPPSLEVVTTSWGMSHDGMNSPSDVSVYYPRPNTFVFASGSIEWSFGLSRPGFVDEHVQRMTENILARAGLAPDAYTTPSPQSPAVDPGVPTRVLSLAGSGTAGYVDGPATQARFDAPAGVTAAPDGTVFVTDSRNHRVRVIALNGMVSTLAGCGPTGVTRSNMGHDGTGSGACFDVPTGIAYGPDGRVYVSDTWNHRIRAITRAGVVTTFAGSGDQGASDSDDPLSASFAFPRGLAFGSDGSLYVADTGNGLVRRIRNGAVTTVAAGFYEPVGVTVASDGTLYVTDSALGTVSAVQGGSPDVLAGSAWTLGDAEGAGSDARLRPGDGVAAGAGVVYFADTANYRIRAVSTAGDHTVSTLLGDGRYGTNNRVVLPRGMFATPGGVLVADSGNNRVILVTP